MADSDQQAVVEIDEQGVRGILHRPTVSSGAGLVLTHGAGANCRSPLLVALATEFCAAGMHVLRYDLPFRQDRPKGPPLRSAERDQQGIGLAIEWMRGLTSGRVFAGGHSYGGRQTTMLAAEQPGVADGLLLLSYPLHPPKSPKQMRTAHFPKLHIPALFVHGTRDGFGTMEEMNAAVKAIPASAQVIPITGAGHELLRKGSEDELRKVIRSAFSEMFLSA